MGKAIAHTKMGTSLVRLRGEGKVNLEVELSETEGSESHCGTAKASQPQLSRLQNPQVGLRLGWEKKAKGHSLRKFSADPGSLPSPLI